MESKNFVGTTTDLAARLKVDYLTATGLIRFLVEKKLASETGKRPSPSGKGKPSTIFTIPESVTLDLSAAPVAVAA